LKSDGFESCSEKGSFFIFILIGYVLNLSKFSNSNFYLKIKILNLSFIDKWKMKEKLDAFARLLEIMDELREKCPWDKND